MPANRQFFPKQNITEFLESGHVKKNWRDHCRRSKTPLSSHLVSASGEMADALASGASGSKSRGGSSPLLRIFRKPDVRFTNIRLFCCRPLPSPPAAFSGRNGAVLLPITLIAIVRSDAAFRQSPDTGLRRKAQLASHCHSPCDRCHIIDCARTSSQHRSAALPGAAVGRPSNPAREAVGH